MVWVEMICLRTTAGRVADVASLVLCAAEQATVEGDLKGFHIYTSATFATDFALSLVWNTHTVHRRGSAAGLSIAEALKSFGLVDHSVWVETPTGYGRRKRRR
jgi:hypothetical protein